ncbi:MAG: hypothetical protein M3A44_13605 [Gammaproteobacteria bacterium]
MNDQAAIDKALILYHAIHYGNHSTENDGFDVGGPENYHNFCIGFT